MISTWDIPKHDFWGKNTFFKNAFSFKHIFNCNKSRRQNPEIV